MKKYYYIKEDKKLGPFDIEDLKSENIKRNTLVWFQGIKDWKKASEIKGLSELFIHLPPPIPTGQTKKFKISLQLMALILVSSSIIMWINIESVVVSGPIVALLSLLSFYLSKGESKNIRAVSLLPFLLCVLIYLLSDTDNAIVETMVTIGTILFIVLTIDKIKQF